MTKEFPMTNFESPDAGNHFVIRASLFFRHYGLVIRDSMEMRLLRGHPRSTTPPAAGLPFTSELAILSAHETQFIF
jgi:hypothetical protein